MQVGTRVAIADLDGFAESPEQGLMVGATGQVVHVYHDCVLVELDVVHVSGVFWHNFRWKFRESALEVLDASVS